MLGEYTLVTDGFSDKTFLLDLSGKQIPNLYHLVIEIGTTLKAKVKATELIKVDSKLTLEQYMKLKSGHPIYNNSGQLMTRNLEFENVTICHPTHHPELY